MRVHETKNLHLYDATISELMRLRESLTMIDGLSFRGQDTMTIESHRAGKTVCEKWSRKDRDGITTPMEVTLFIVSGADDAGNIHEWAKFTGTFPMISEEEEVANGR